MSTIGDVVESVLKLSRLDSKDVITILDKLNAIGDLQRKAMGSNEVNEAILDWVRDHFMCTGTEKCESNDLEWA